MKTCCIIGQQNLSKTQIEIAEKEIKKHVERCIKAEYTHFIIGLNNKAEVLASKIIVELKTQNKKILFEIILPYQKKVQSKAYKEALNKCDRSKCLFEKYSKMCSWNHISRVVRNSNLVIIVHSKKNDEKIIAATQVAHIKDKETLFIKV